jgi:hypothetical protein
MLVLLGIFSMNVTAVNAEPPITDDDVVNLLEEMLVSQEAVIDNSPLDDRKKGELKDHIVRGKGKATETRNKHKNFLKDKRKKEGEPSEEAALTNYDNDSKDEIVQSLGRAKEKADELNDLLLANAAPSVASQSVGIMAADAGDGLYQAQYPFGKSQRANDEVMTVAAEYVNYAEKAFMIMEAVCQQDILGNNISASCIAPAVIVAVAKGTYDAFKILDDGIDAAEIRGSYERAKNIYDEVLDLQVSVDSGQDDLAEDLDSINNKLDTLQTRLDALERNLTDLLITPQGRRPGFPAK